MRGISLDDDGLRPAFLIPGEAGAGRGCYASSADRKAHGDGRKPLHASPTGTLLPKLAAAKRIKSERSRTETL